MKERYFGNPLLLIKQTIRNAAYISLFMVASSALAAPITTNTALPVHAGGLIVRGQAKVIRSTDDPSPMARELTVWAAPSVLVYGVREKFTLFGIIPYLDKNLDFCHPSGCGD